MRRESEEETTAAMHHFALIILILVVTIYLIVGGFIFWALESDRELQHEAKRMNFNLTYHLTNFTGECVSLTWPRKETGGRAPY